MRRSLQGGIYCRACSAAGRIAGAGKSNDLAVVSLVLSIVGIPLYFCYGAGILFGVAGLIVGAVARNQIKNSNGMQRGNGMALASMLVGGVPLCLGILAACVIVILLGPVVSNVFSTTVSNL